MHKVISIEDIESAKNKTLSCVFNEKIDGIDAVEPVCAHLTFRALGDFIEVTGNVKSTLKLLCDVCLEEFKYKLNFDIDELFAKRALVQGIEESGQEIEIKEGQFVTDLNGSDEIDIYDLLYQSVILNVPNKKVCGINCKGGGVFQNEENISDPRLDVFKHIKIEDK